MVYIPKTRYDQAYQSIVSSARKAISLVRHGSSSSAATVLILVSADADALSACKILTKLLRDDCIGYRVLPVPGWSELARIHAEQILDNEDLRSIVLLNLGSLLDLSESFPLPAGATCHVIDSHRPWNLGNLFAGGPEAEQIIVWDDGDIEDELKEEKEAFQTIQYEPESDSEDDDSDSDDELPGTRRQRSPSSADDDDEDSDADEAADSQRRKKRRRTTDGEGSSDPPEEVPRLSKKKRRQYKSRISKYYNAGTFYGQSVAMQLYVLATLLERTNNDLLWFAIMGLTYQFNAALIDRERYDTYAVVLQDEVARLNIHHDVVLNVGGAYPVSGPTDRSIRPAEELRLTLFRHWNLYDSMYHSGYVAGKLKLWRDRGRKNLQGLLAKMGFSLQQCQQSFAHMDMDLKMNLRNKVDSIAPEYGLFDLVYPSFIRASGYQSVMSASDAVESLSSLLEVGTAVRLDFGLDEGIKTWGAYCKGEEDTGGKENAAPAQAAAHAHASDVARSSVPGAEPLGPKGRQALAAATEETESAEKAVAQDEDQWWVKNFWLAWHALSADCAQMRRALVLSMALHRSVIRQGISMLDKQSIRTLRTFRLAIVREGPDVAVFAHPATLGRLAVWLVDAIRDLVPKDDKLKRRKGLPFVAACLDERRDAYLVVGVNGATEYGDVRKNRFGLAFQEAAQLSGARTRHDKFDAAVVEIRKDDLQDFIDRLHTTLA